MSCRPQKCKPLRPLALKAQLLRDSAFRRQLGCCCSCYCCCFLGWARKTTSKHNLPSARCIANFRLLSAAKSTPVLIAVNNICFPHHLTLGPTTRNTPKNTHTHRDIHTHTHSYTNKARHARSQLNSVPIDAVTAPTTIHFLTHFYLPFVCHLGSEALLLFHLTGRLTSAFHPNCHNVRTQ